MLNRICSRIVKVKQVKIFKQKSDKNTLFSGYFIFGKCEIIVSEKKWGY